MPDLTPAEERALAVQIAQAQRDRVQSLQIALETNAQALVDAVSAAVELMGATPGPEQTSVARMRLLLTAVAEARAGVTADLRELTFFIDPPTPDQV